jgi:4-hydroxy-tetrahydrodipicolinate reductase
MIKLCLAGGFGKMGRAVASMAAAESDLRVVSVYETARAISLAADYGKASRNDRNRVKASFRAEEAVGLCDVVVDFSVEGAFDDLVRACDKLCKPLVTGTTAIPDKARRLGGLAAKVAVVSSPNMATGVNVVFALCRTLARVLGQVSDIEVVETHHRTKKDVPSGTALEIGKILGSETGRALRVGRADGGLERGGEVFIHSLRLGDVAGKHRVIFAPAGEVLELTHTAQSRACFAAGALHAVRFAVRSDPGLYDMLDVLGLRTEIGGER